MSPQTTSPEGRAALEAEEGVVLRAYRDVVGVWTIGAGLTAASGVITPASGMVITADEASRLLSRALAESYEPSVRAAMPGASQHEFDAGVSFHFNTGAIGRATWVSLWRGDRVWDAIRASLLSWNRAGGKVTGGLMRRREREYTLLRHGIYSHRSTAPVDKGARMARMAAPVTVVDHARARVMLTDLGYAVGSDSSGIAEAALRQFQADHDLMADGILGRASWATIQRMHAARAAARKAAGPVTIGTAGLAGLDAFTDLLAPPPWIIPALIVLGFVWAGWRLWHYRDAVAAKVQGRAPLLAAWLRRF